MLRPPDAAYVVLAVVGALVLGLVVAVLGTFHHPSVVTVGGTRLPVGVLVGIGALVLAQVVARSALPHGIGPAVVLAGWTIGVIALGMQTPAGDLAIPADDAGQAFLYGGFVAGLVTAGAFAFGRLAPTARVAAARPPTLEPAEPASGDDLSDR